MRKYYYGILRSDGSKEWTKYYRNKLKVQNKDEGTFWMHFDDFIQYFHSLWVCRVMEPKCVKDGLWDDQSATGTKNIKNAPQFNIAVTNLLFFVAILKSMRFLNPER